MDKRATEAGTPAKGVQMPAPYSRHHIINGAVNLYAEDDVKAYGDARAEEARREALKEQIEQYRKGYRHGYEEGKTEISERTAGGDAGYQRALEEIAALRGKGECINDVLDIADSALAGLYTDEPLAEAAVQADDGTFSYSSNPFEDMPTMGCRAAYYVRNPLGEYTYASPQPTLLKPEYRNAIAAPTAQPTPEQPVEYHGLTDDAPGEISRERRARMVEHVKYLIDHPEVMKELCKPSHAAPVPISIDPAAMFQPTPPDDERAAFEAWANENAIRMELGAWDAWKARAALRQPGALPDEAEAMKLIEALLAAWDRDFSGDAYGAEMRRIETEARALAAKPRPAT